MGHYLRLYRTIGMTFGVWVRPIGAFLLLQLRQAISATTLGLDHVFYPRHRKQSIDRPIFNDQNRGHGPHVRPRLFSVSVKQPPCLEMSYGLVANGHKQVGPSRSSPACL